MSRQPAELIGLDGRHLLFADGTRLELPAALALDPSPFASPDTIRVAGRDAAGLKRGTVLRVGGTEPADARATLEQLARIVEGRR